MKKIIIGLFLVGFLIVPMFSFAQVGDIDPNPDANTCVSLQSSNLRYRARDINTNGEVSTLQDFLQSQGYLNNEPTGYLGILTVKAVKDFQKANKINPTGYVGTVTKAKIQSLTCNGIIPEPNEQKFTGYLFTQGLTTFQWGTHTIVLDENINCTTASDMPCAQNLRAKSYPIKAINNSVLSDLNLYQNSKVIILGKLGWYELEGGFWGIVASKVISSSGNFNKPIISGVSGPQTLNVNQAGTWTVKAYDKSGGNLSYSVNWGDIMRYCPSGGGPCSETLMGQKREIQQSATFTHSYSQAGTYTPTFYVTNSSGQSATTSLTVKVWQETLTCASDKPSITVLSPNGGEVYQAGQKIEVKWTSCNIPVADNNIHLVVKNISTNQRYYLIGYDDNSSHTINDGVEVVTILPQIPSGQYKLEISRLGSGVGDYDVNDSSDNSFTINNSNSTLDTTPRIMYWWGKVNQHVDSSGNWLTDPDGTSGANLDKLTYCKKWFPNTTSVEDYKLETIDTWRNAGNQSAFTSIKMSTKCVQGMS